MQQLLQLTLNTMNCYITPAMQIYNFRMKDKIYVSELAINLNWNIKLRHHDSEIKLNTYGNSLKFYK